MHNLIARLRRLIEMLDSRDNPIVRALGPLLLWTTQTAMAIESWRAANGPQVAMRLLKRAVSNAASLTFDQAGDDIASKTAISDFHRDAVEGAPAFFAREPAQFNKWLTGDDQNPETH